MKENQTPSNFTGRLKNFCRISKSKVLVSFILMFGLTSAKAQNVFMPRPAFQPGEKISFTVFYNVIGMYINAGSACFTTNMAKHGNANAYHVVAEGATNKKYDWIFKVRDRYESIFDEDFNSLKFTRQVQEGHIKFQEDVVFNKENNTAVTDKKTYKVPPSIMDVINAIYYARNIDYDSYKEGDKISFNMFLDNQVYNMYIRYLGKEEIKTRYGKFKAVKLRPLLLKGSIFEGGENMTMWVTDDDNHIPVRIESNISVGKVKVDLMEYANLKHPLNSLMAKN
jgi:hypothetical protein